MFYGFISINVNALNNESRLKSFIEGKYMKLANKDAIERPMFQRTKKMRILTAKIKSKDIHCT